MKKGIFALIFGVFLNFSLSASMVSFYVIETGLPLEGAKNQHSQRWEGAFMDVFFEAGYIVSNAPILRLETRPEGEITDYISFDMEEARDAGIDFMLLIQLDYTNESNIPSGIAFTIYRVSPREKIYEQRLSGKRYTTSRDEVEDLKKIIGKLIPYISK